MSLLNRLNRTAHLDDGALAALLADVSPSRGSVAVTHEHLERCAACRARLAAFEEWLNSLRDDANAEADEAFPLERLATQHGQIMRRLEAAERPARVIAFPRFAQPISTGGHGAHRWIVAAAAAGLVVGVAVGQLMDLRTATFVRSSTGAPDTTIQVPGSQRVAITPINATASEEMFLAVLDDSVSVRGVPELRPMDQLTPGGRDYTADSR